MKYGLALLVLMSVVFSQAVLAADEPKKAPASQPAVVDIGDKTALEAAVGKDVIVEGTVSEAKWSSNGKVFLIKFKEGAATRFQGAVFAKSRDTMEKAFDGDLSKALEGSKVQLSGKVQTFKEHQEIVINIPKQITILTKGAGAGPATRPSN